MVKDVLVKISMCMCEMHPKYIVEMYLTKKVKLLRCIIQELILKIILLEYGFKGKS